MPIYEIHTTQVITETYRLLVQADDEEAATDWVAGISDDLLDVHGAERTQRSDVEDGDIKGSRELEGPADTETEIFRATWDDGTATIAYHVPDGWQSMETAPKVFTTTTNFTGRPVPLLVRHSPAILLTHSRRGDIDEQRAIWGRADELGAATYPCWRSTDTGTPISFIPVGWRPTDSLEGAGTAIEGNGEDAGP